MLRRRACASLLAGWTVACASTSGPAPFPPPFSRAQLALVEPERGAIQGAVHQPTTGARIAGARVILECSCIPNLRETRTDARGLYSFGDLPAGSYSVQVIFQNIDVSQSMALPLGVQAIMHFALAPTRDLRRD